MPADQKHGTMRPAGDLTLVRARDLGDLALSPTPSLLWTLRNWRQRLRGIPAGVGGRLLGSLKGTLTLQSSLTGVRYRPDPRLSPERAQRLRDLLADHVDPREIARSFGGSFTDFGLLSTRVVTDAGVAFLVDALHASATIANLKFHGFGTGTTAEAQSDTALVTELTTQYAVNNTRPTGTQTETAANVYSTAATLIPDADVAITEHGLFDQAAVGGGTLLDRSKFAAVNLNAAGGDSLAVTYNLTLSAGG